jgi:serine/threonine protein kinase/O-acetyl-ADP-ribose deacetylase (regulator of RNase III)
MPALSRDDRDRIGEIVERFESSWKSGDRPRLESFLVESLEGTAREELVRALLRVELEQRRARGETPRPEDYASRLPGHEPTIQATIESFESAESACARPVDSPVELPDLPDYEVLEVIGRGAMGTVFRARHRKLQRPAAIKIIFPGRSADRFRREARLISGIRSPHVVGVHDFRLLPDGRLVLIMEYVAGSDLRGAMEAKGGSIAEDQAVKWMSDVCEGMTAASEQGIIHRDLKPANILIDGKCRALVADFGLARSESALSDMTLSDSVMGTPHYMAPEQAEDPRGVDTRADIYSFGATFYHALTGAPPFEGNSVFSILCKHKSDPLVSPRSRNPKISDRVCSIIERCLAKSPGDRFPTFAEVKEQLDHGPGRFSPWDMTEDPQLTRYLEQYKGRRRYYLEKPGRLPAEGDVFVFPRGRKIVILHGNIVHEAVDAIVSSDTFQLSMNYGVSLAIRSAGGSAVAQEAMRYGPVRPGRAVVTSAGKLRARYVFHGVTVGISSGGVVVPSRDLIAEIMASCFYHADSLEVRSIAFPLLGTGAMGFSRGICLDTMFQSLARVLLYGLSSLVEARIVLFDGPQ